MACNVTFSPDAWADYLYWQIQDKKTLKRINWLLQQLLSDGFASDLSKMEQLRHAEGMSMCIDKKNRLGFTMEGDNLVVLSCRGRCEY